METLEGLGGKEISSEIGVKVPLVHRCLNRRTLPLDGNRGRPALVAAPRLPGKEDRSGQSGLGHHVVHAFGHQGEGSFERPVE